MSIYRITCTKNGVRRLLSQRFANFLECRRYVKKFCQRTGRIYTEDYIRATLLQEVA
jgi:hypothetical protein